MTPNADEGRIIACAHCDAPLLSPFRKRRCRHGLLCLRCAWELEEWASDERFDPSPNDSLGAGE